MFLATGSLIIPAGFAASLPDRDSLESQAKILSLSRGTAVVTLIIYIFYLIFQLRTHTYLFDRTARLEFEAEEEDQSVQITKGAAALCLFVSTVAAGVCSDYLVSSIDDVIKSSGISKTFMGLIIIPIVANAGIHLIKGYL
jgi:Ca2+:H+ antiporter